MLRDRNKVYFPGSRVPLGFYNVKALAVDSVIRCAGFFRLMDYSFGVPGLQSFDLETASLAFYELY